MENQTNTLRIADNKVNITGKVSEVESKTGVSQKSGVAWIGGKVKVQTDANSIHEVRFFQMAQYKDKKTGQMVDNKSYKGIVKFLEEVKTVQSVGQELADWVNVKNGTLTTNEYVGGDGQFACFPQVEARYFSRVTKEEDKVGSTQIAVEAFVKAIRPEIKNDEETGALILDVLIPEYGGKIAPITMVVRDQGGVGYIENNVQAGQTTVVIKAELLNSAVVEEKITEMGFGTPIVEKIEKYEREIRIIGLQEFAEEHPSSYNVADIQKALVERENMIEQMKVEAKEKAKKDEANLDNNASLVGTGFGVKPDPVDIPF